MKFYYRLFQMIFRMASYLFNYRRPKLLTGKNSLLNVPVLLQEIRVKQVLIVTDEAIYSLGLIDELLRRLKQDKIQVSLYSKTVPNPTITNVEEALHMYKQNHCQAVIAIGGGSPIDCAKAICARVARPNKTIEDMKGVLKVRKEIPPLIAIPTTAGTGSEATLASVISNEETKEKYALMDHALIPQYAVHDPMLLVNLPPYITAITGIDTLTHAIEAYIGKSNTKETKQLSEEVVKLVFKYLYVSYQDGENIEARERMLEAAYKGGVAFSRAYVGNIHAIAHTLSGFYDTPHGLANAVILPYVLEYYGDVVHRQLAKLADLIEITASQDTAAEKANKFIQVIRQLNDSMDIPRKITDIQEEDIPTMIKRALDEANPLYPVPKIFTEEDMKNIYKKIQT
ncbi:MAG TPA: iron-containing alcohol dehydrogenase [Bacillota bacterium]|nr:iron-containing alcohol dehydrogenase [Bacillota bacterium]